MRTSAMPDMPMPPMPTKWMGPSSSGSLVAAFMSGLSCQLFDEGDEAGGGVGLPLGQCIARHGLGGFGVAEDRGDVARQRGGVKQLFRDHHGGIGLGQPAGIGGLVVAGGRG